MKSQKNKLLSIVNKLSSFDLSNHFYSLTINFENIINSFDDVEFDINSIKKEINNFNDKIKSFNLSINNYGGYNESRYKLYYFNADLIFHSEGIVFSFNSPHLSNREMEVSDINKLFKIYEEHKISSEKLYNLISSNNSSKDIIQSNNFIEVKGFSKFCVETIRYSYDIYEKFWFDNVSFKKLSWEELYKNYKEGKV